MVGNPDIGGLRLTFRSQSGADFLARHFGQSQHSRLIVEPRSWLKMVRYQQPSAAAAVEKFSVACLRSCSET
jgi:hypothetical protein